MLILFGNSFCNTDGAGRANQAAEMAAYALGADNHRLPVRPEVYGLMATVGAGNRAPAAADTKVAVYLGEDYGVAVKVMRQIELGQDFANQVCQIADSAAGHIVLEAENHIVDDAVAVLHY